MPLTPRDSAPPPKVELETVTRWPALLAAAGAGTLLLGVPLLLATASILGSLRHEAAVSRTPLPDAPARPVIVQPLEVPEPAPLPTPAREEPRPAVRIVVIAPRVQPAPQPAPGPVATTTVRQRFVRSHLPSRHERSEAGYLKELANLAREVDLNNEKGVAEKILREAREAKVKKAAATGASPPAHPMLTLLPKRADLAGLPAIGAAECQRDAKTAARMEEISTTIRPLQAVQDRLRASSQTPPPRFSLSTSLDIFDHVQREWLKEDGIPILVQMIQAGDTDQRLRLVQLLSRSQARAATDALARRALYDLSGEVREAAVRILGQLPIDDYRPLLLAGLRYPWPPVGDHAAEALVALNDDEAVPDLVNLLDQQDPRSPEAAGKGKWVVPELVRVNHLRNCLLCHAPALNLTDPVRGLVPTPGEPLPVPYCDSRDGTFVRADVTYLRQDFSVMQPVARDYHWPPVQRFDYLVRCRELTPAEAKAHEAALAARPKGVRPASYPQREAVLFALRKLTGLQAGDSSLDWRLALWMKENTFSSSPAGARAEAPREKSP
jgi:hypothetical protein